MSLNLSEHMELTESSGLFDPKWYSNRYPDVASLEIDPMEHFVRFGLWLQRDPGPGFSCQHYLTAYPDIAKNKINPFLHYVKHGRNEGRTPTKNGRLDAGQATPDDNGNLERPNRSPHNGRDFMSLSYNRQHYWYQNDDTRKFIADIGNQSLLPEPLRRILVVGHDAKMSTGVFRSISHYLNLMAQAGGHELTSVEPGKETNGWTLINDFDAHDFVIVNSLALFAYHDGVAQQLVERCHGKAAVYLHETGWGFDGFEENFPERYQEFLKYAPQLDFFCVSEAQKSELRQRFGVTKAQVVYETTTLPAVGERRSSSDTNSVGGRLRVLMAGTVQPRKGTELFSKVADLAKEAGLPWDFRWAGWTADDSCYQSPNVNFLGNLTSKELAEELQQSDVFFLSSKDDPFPLACLEAILSSKRVMVYRKTGIAEVLDGVDGTGVFEKHEAEDAFDVLKRVVNAQIEPTQYKALQDLVGIKAFTERMNSAIQTVWEAGGRPVRPRQASTQKIAVILHLYYLDLWPEFQSYFRNLGHLDYELYVTLSEEADPDELSDVRARILNFRKSATVLTCENRGMDIGPFMSVTRHIVESGKSYDLMLKVHSKKSLVASGASAGEKWRKSLLDGLMGAATRVDQIVDLLETHHDIGMISPRGMLIQKSSSDQRAGKNVNADNMVAMADRMGLSDIELSFFRGSMFWCNAKPVLEACARADFTIDEFDYGHQPDDSKAHAMERLFACIIRSAGQRLHQFDSRSPKPVSLLKNREKGRDIYVIAAGASCDYIDPSFFDGKCVIAVNRAFVRFPASYVIYKEYAGLDNEEQMLDCGAVPVIANWHAGNIVEGRRRPNSDYFIDQRYYFFDHLENRRDKVDYSNVGPESDKLVVSYSTITSAMHLAAYLGARNIIIVGHDCGTIDGKSTFDGYYKSYFISPWKDQDEYREWLSLIEEQTLNTKKAIKEHYGCNIHSINPFVNMGLEGHEYSRALPKG